MQSTSQTTSVLIVGDDLDTASFLESSLGLLGFEMTRAANAMEALPQLRSRSFDVIICEINMPKMSGEDLYHEVEKEMPWLLPHFCFVTGDPKIYGHEGFLSDTRARWIQKPFSFDQLAGVLNEILLEAHP